MTEVRGEAWAALPARPGGVGRAQRSHAIAHAIERARLEPASVRWMSPAASGDVARDAWHDTLEEASAPWARSLAVVGERLGQYAGLGPARVAAAALANGPVLVHAVARGGSDVALIVEAPAR